MPVTRWRADVAVAGVSGDLRRSSSSGSGCSAPARRCSSTRRLGVSPWTVLAQGVDEQSGIGIGWATFLISLVVLLLWIPLRERPGLGTVANAVVIAVALGVTAPLLPEPAGHRLAGRSRCIGGIALIGLGSGLYLTCGLGPGPTGRLDDRAAPPHRASRSRSSGRCIEVTVLAGGWALGGTVGVGTVAFALFIGPSVGYGLRLVDRVGGTGATSPARTPRATDA